MHVTVALSGSVSSSVAVKQIDLSPFIFYVERVAVSFGYCHTNASIKLAY